MTRFQIIGIFEDKILAAGEFNGDGYFEDGHGEELCSMFPEVKTEKDYRKIVKDMNDQHFEYDGQLIFNLTENPFVEDGVEYDIFDFYTLRKRNLYFKCWFSDYLYIINLSDDDKEIIDENGIEITVKQGGWVTINFGELYKQEDLDSNIKCMSNVEISSSNHIWDLIEEEGWWYSIDKDSGYCDIGISSRAGEDFFFTIDTNGTEDIATQILNEADNFDPDEHVVDFIRSGASGIPNVRDLIDDADWISNALCDLAEKVNGRTDNHMITPILPELALEMLNKFKGMSYKMWEMMDVKVEEYLLEDAEYVVVAYGIAARVAKEAINNLRQEGYKVGMVRPITLYPFPKASLDNLDYGRVKGIIDVEMTIPAQMRDDIELQVKGRCPVHEYGRSGGMLLDDEGVYGAIADIVKGGE